MDDIQEDDLLTEEELEELELLEQLPAYLQGQFATRKRKSGGKKHKPDVERGSVKGKARKKAIESRTESI